MYFSRIGFTKSGNVQAGAYKHVKWVAEHVLIEFQRCARGFHTTVTVRTLPRKLQKIAMLTNLLGDVVHHAVHIWRHKLLLKSLQLSIFPQSYKILHPLLPPYKCKCACSMDMHTQLTWDTCIVTDPCTYMLRGKFQYNYRAY